MVEDMSGTPAVSLKRTYMILLIVYVVAALFALLAGAALTWHVDPFSECLLYSHTAGDKVVYGHEASKSDCYLSPQQSSAHLEIFSILCCLCPKVLLVTGTTD